MKIFEYVKAINLGALAICLFVMAIFDMPLTTVTKIIVGTVLAFSSFEEYEKVKNTLENKENQSEN